MRYIRKRAFCNPHRNVFLKPKFTEFMPSIGVKRPKSFVCFTVMLTVTQIAFAGKLDKAFEALYQFNYFDAKVLFEKSIDKNPAGAAYGLSLIHANPVLPYYDADTAYVLIVRADSAFKVVDLKRKEYLKELGVTADSIAVHKKRVSTLFFERIHDSKSVSDFQTFLDTHPWAIEIETARERRNELAFAEASAKNTYQAFAAFLEAYPDASQAEEAKEQYDALFFKTMTQASTETAYRKFIRDYPESPYRSFAEKRVYELSTEAGTVSAYRSFIEQNPANPYVEQAWTRIYRLRIRYFTPGELSEFLLDFPDYPDRDEVLADLELARKPFYPVKEGDQWGFVDSTGEWLIRPYYDWVEPFTEGKAIAGIEMKAGFINKRGEEVIPLVFDDVLSFSGFKAVAEIAEYYGMIDYLGDTVVSFIHDDIGDVAEGRILAERNELMGYYNAKGKLIIPFQFDDAYEFENGLARVQLGDRWGMIDPVGRWVLDTLYESLSNPIDSAVVAETEAGYGVINLKGDTLIPFEYERIGSFRNDRALVIGNESYAYVNTKGERVVEGKFDYDLSLINYAEFSEGYAKYKYRGKFGLIDTVGDRVFPAIFEDIGAYDSLRTPVKRYGKWGYADAEVDLKIKYTYDYAWSFSDGLAKVEKADKRGLIGLDGTVVIPVELDDLEQVLPGLYLTQQDGKKGVRTASNEPVIPEIFEEIYRLDEEVLDVRIQGKMGLFHLGKRAFMYSETGFSTAMLGAGIPTNDSDE